MTAGYLTIKDYDKEYKLYKVGFPNKEVKDGFLNYLLYFYAPVQAESTDALISRMSRDIRSGNAEDKFKRYEDSSLEYTGIDKHCGTVIGLWDTAIDTAQMPEQYDGRVEDETTDPAVLEDVNPWENLQVGDIVVHKSIGEGEVMSLEDNYIVAKFHDRESKFHYPSAFEKGYLSVE